MDVSQRPLCWTSQAPLHFGMVYIDEAGWMTHHASGRCHARCNELELSQQRNVVRAVLAVGVTPR